MIYRVHEPLIESLREAIGYEERQLCFILDNSPVYLSKKVQNYLKEKSCKWVFLPQYTPELAPVELFFGEAKKLVSQTKTKKMINLETSRGREFLEDKIGSIDQIAVLKLWRHFFGQIKDSINQFRSILNVTI